MKLLLRRSQISAALFSLVPLRIGSGVIFTLNAELELDDEETALINKYKLTKAPLVVSDLIDDIRQSVRPAILLGVVAFIVLYFIVSFSTAVSISLLIIVAMTVVYYRALTENLIVSDLLAGGRTFRCDSIVHLVKKEAYLEAISGYLRQVLESAKHWDDREAINIKPLSKEEAKLAVLKG